VADTARALLALQPTPPERGPRSTGRAQTTAVPLRAAELTLHGHRLSYRTAGSGPPLVLLHGIASSSMTWEQVTPWLSKHYTLIAPDFLGHGESATPRGDYSLGAHAGSVRDLLTALGHDRVTVVGHSLGGGVAMQFAYLFPERCERLVLVSSGGLGREVHYALRAAALPGADWVLPFLASRGLLRIGHGLGGLLGRVRVRPGGDLQEVARGFASLGTAGSRQAFLHTLRAVVDTGGQRVSANDRLSRAADLPTLIVWGARDQIIPRRHGAAAHAAMPGSRLIVFEGAGHFPHADDPRRFAAVLSEFYSSTEAVRLAHDHWRPRIDDASEGAQS
jgi:pimeloyl-ACP methyl ester carboxylesterase